MNLPEEATVEEVEELHIESWRLGLKAVAVYRDNCKVGSAARHAEEGRRADAEPVDELGTRSVERIVEHRDRAGAGPPEAAADARRRRRSRSGSPTATATSTVGEYEDGRPGELFLKVAKQGSTLAGIMDAFAISVSHGLQYGVPLEAFVEMFTNMRFEPAGMTDDPELRFATSLVDYIFRRLAVEYMPHEERDATSASSRSGERLAADAARRGGGDDAERATGARAPARGPGAVGADAARRRRSAAHRRRTHATRASASDVLCHVCGDIMQRAGSCHACPSCGATSGCS